MSHDDILLVRTGGTVDSEPYPDPKNPPPIVTTLKGDKSPVARMMKERYPHIALHTWSRAEEERFVKDSQEYTPENIRTLVQFALNQKQRHIIPFHGTSAMAENATAFAAELRQQAPGHDKVIAFLGGMVPLSMHGTTDRYGNEIVSDVLATLDFTLAGIKSTSPGIYIVGHDAHTKRRAFLEPEKVRKDIHASTRDLNFTLMAR